MIRHPLCVLSLLAGFWISIATAPAQPQESQGKGSSACASCHRAQAESQPKTPMAHALELPGSNPILSGHSKLTVKKGDYLYTVETKGDASTYTVTDGKQTVTLPIQWSFGKHSQTWVFQRDGDWYEGLVSYYATLDGLDTTIGDGALTPRTVDEAVGRKLLKNEIRDCFGCHSSDSVHQGNLTLETLKPGVTCEHCHIGANGHLLDVLQGDYGSTPPRLSKLSTESISSFCGQCHRTWETVVRNRWRGPIDVRFQPYRLANSKCFDGTDPRISCLACHDPHQDVVRQDTGYDSKCLACHAAAPKQVASQSSRDAKVCPVAKSKCVTCHMPKIPLPGGHAKFTDHQIRVVKEGESFPD